MLEQNRPNQLKLNGIPAFYGSIYSRVILKLSQARILNKRLIISLFTANSEIWSLLNRQEHSKQKIVAQYLKNISSQNSLSDHQVRKKCVLIFNNFQFLIQEFSFQQQLNYLKLWLILMMSLLACRIGEHAIGRQYFQYWFKISKKNNKLVKFCETEQMLGYLGDKNQIIIYLEKYKNLADIREKYIKRWTYLTTQVFSKFNTNKHKSMAVEKVLEKKLKILENGVTYIKNKQKNKNLTYHRRIVNLKITHSIIDCEIFNYLIKRKKDLKISNSIIQQYEDSPQKRHFNYIAMKPTQYSNFSRIQIIDNPHQIIDHYLQLHRYLSITDQLFEKSEGFEYSITNDSSEFVILAPLSEVYSALYQLKFFWAGKPNIQHLQKSHNIEIIDSYSTILNLLPEYHTATVKVYLIYSYSDFIKQFHLLNPKYIHEIFILSKDNQVLLPSTSMSISFFASTKDLLKKLNYVSRFETFFAPNFSSISDVTRISQNRYKLSWFLNPHNKSQAQGDFFSFVQQSRWMKNSSQAPSNLHNIRQSLKSEGIRKSEALIQLYTSQSFFHIIINYTLRNLFHPSHFAYLRYIVSQLYLTIRQLYAQQYAQKYRLFQMICYRGTLFTDTQIQFLQSNKGDYIQLEGFVSTSTKKQKAQAFNQDLIIIKVENGKYSPFEAGFANLAEKSILKGQFQILFNPFNYFKILSITYNQKTNSREIQLQYIFISAILFKERLKTELVTNQMKKLIFHYRYQKNIICQKLKTQGDLFFRLGMYKQAYHWNIQFLRKRLQKLACKLNQQNSKIEQNGQKNKKQLEEGRIIEEVSSQIILPEFFIKELNIPTDSMYLMQYQNQLIRIGQQVPIKETGVFYMMGILKTKLEQFELASSFFKLERLVNYTYKTKSCKQLKDYFLKFIQLQYAEVTFQFKMGNYTKNSQILKILEISNKYLINMTSNENSEGNNQNIIIQKLSLALLYAGSSDYHTAISKLQQIQNKINKHDVLRYYHYLNKAIVIYNMSENFNKAKELSLKNIQQLSNAIGMQNMNIVYFYENLADSYLNNLQFQNALLEYQRSLKTMKKYYKDNYCQSFIARIVNKIAHIYFLVKNYDKSLIYFTQSLGIYAKLENKNVIQMVKIKKKMAETYFILELEEKSICLLTQTQKQCKNNKNNPQLIEIYILKCKIYNKLKCQQKAQYYFTEAMNYLKLKSEGKNLGNIKSLLKIYQLNYNHRQTQQAIKILQSIREIYNSYYHNLEDPKNNHTAIWAYSKILRLIAKVYYKIGNYEKTIHYTEISLSIISKDEGKFMNYPSIYAIYNLIISYLKVNQNNKAICWFKKLCQMRQTLPLYKLIEDPQIDQLKESISKIGKQNYENQQNFDNFRMIFDSFM